MLQSIEDFYTKFDQIFLTWPSGTSNGRGGLPRRLFLLPTGRGIFSVEKYYFLINTILKFSGEKIYF